MCWYDWEWNDKLIKHRYMDLQGNPIKRTPTSHPYNYDEYVIWKDANFNVDICDVVYSDRLYQWDSQKYNMCSQEVFQNQGQYFSKREPNKIEKFLSLYFGKSIKLKAITQGCNQATGYPYWVFFYEYK